MLALAQASAQELTVIDKNPAGSHGSRVKPPKTSSIKSASLGIPVTDPYATPLGARKGKGQDFLSLVSSPPVEPKGGFTIKAGRDSPDAPMTGGLMFRF